MIEKELSEAEFLSFGIDPNNPLGGSRTPGCPVDARFGDNRIVRSSSGAISIHFGYYSESQKRIRRFKSEILCSNLKSLFKS